MRSNQWFAHFVFSTFPCRVHNTYQGPENRINAIEKVKMLVTNPPKTEKQKSLNFSGKSPKINKFTKIWKTEKSEFSREKS